MTIHKIAPSVDKFDTLDEQVNGATTGLWSRVDTLENADPVYTLIKAHDITKSYAVGYPILKDGSLRLANTAVSAGAYNDSQWTNPGTRAQTEPVITTTSDGVHTMTFTATTGGGTIEVSDGTTTKTMSINSDRGRLNFASACDLADANATDVALVGDIVKLDGDLGGTLASPVVSGIRGVEVDDTPPEASQILAYDAADDKYVPSDITEILADYNKIGASGVITLTSAFYPTTASGVVVDNLSTILRRVNKSADSYITSDGSSITVSEGVWQCSLTIHTYCQADATGTAKIYPTIVDGNRLTTVGAGKTLATGYDYPSTITFLVDASASAVSFELTASTATGSSGTIGFRGFGDDTRSTCVHLSRIQ